MRIIKYLNKKGLALRTAILLIIALLILLFVIFGYLGMRKVDVGAITYVKNLFRFGTG